MTTTDKDVLEVHPDRLLPPEPGLRAIARELYHAVKDLPIISPHGHVPPQWLADDVPFTDPTSLLITPDHYINRLLHASGVSLADLGVNQPTFSAEQSRNAFRLLCQNWKSFRGTPMKFWFESELADVFGIDLVPSAGTADAIYDRIAEAIVTPEFRPRALYKRFNIEFIATTDDPADDLRHHIKLENDPTWEGKVAPTFRPDKYLEPATPAWNSLVDTLGAVSGEDTGTYAGWVSAMENRRAFFKEHGAVSSDHSHRDAGMEKLDDAEAERLYAKARGGEITREEGDALRRDFMFQQARMASEDGLVMTLHPAVVRNHHTPSLEQFGADVGGDIPMQVEFADALKPVLSAFGTAPNFQLVLFTIDETVYSRELAPLAGFYPSVYVGAPWWFIDEAEAIKRYRRAITGSAGFSRTSGFIDDTRAFLSIPARHDMNRRLDSGFLAELVADHRLTMDEALDTAHDLVVTQPRKAFKL
ncbi:glucuronate isomerase [Georgenia yuyongxinii]|uniref:Uronate isomerase n=1 Tax=Georgenia yuyongxinii TaxID=2589797 RepID=A0A5B8C2B6_9MICO|nr:glucuronate isomerase [Georgenia yuyongxinii]QDC24733.1 glucuronate isomerase [Georgenia yuyongxinii]